MTPGDRPRSGAFGGLPWSSAAEQDPIHARRRVACNWARGRGGAGRARPNVSRQGPAGGGSFRREHRPARERGDERRAPDRSLRSNPSDRPERERRDAPRATERERRRSYDDDRRRDDRPRDDRQDRRDDYRDDDREPPGREDREDRRDRYSDVALSRAGRRIRPCGTARNPARTKPSWSTVTAITAAAARGSAAPITAVR